MKTKQLETRVYSHATQQDYIECKKAGFELVLYITGLEVLKGKEPAKFKKIMNFEEPRTGKTMFLTTTNLIDTMLTISDVHCFGRLQLIDDGIEYGFIGNIEKLVNE